MPIDNVSGEASLDYLTDGITDHIINRLMLVPRLRVMSRNATQRYKGTAIDVRAIASGLSVGCVLLGSLTRNNEQTVITIELVNANDGHLLLSRTYVRPDADFVSLPLRIAADVAEHLQMAITPAVRASILKEPTASADAHRSYLHARECLNRLDPASLLESIRWNDRAVTEDPDFATAYSDMSRAYLKLALFFDPREMMPSALKHARRALDIDATLADAHINIGVVKLMYDWDWDGAERELFLTSELHPKTAEAFSCASHVLESAGRNVNAEHFIRRGLLSDPRSVALLTELGCNSYAHRRFDGAITEFRDALEVDPRNPIAYWGLGRCYAQKAMYAEALAELQRVEELNGFAPPPIVSEIGYVLARSGRNDEAGSVIDRLKEMRGAGYIDPYLIAIIYAGMEKSDEALTWLEAACDERSGFAVAVQSEPKWDFVRGGARFRGVLQRLGFQNAPY
jgi:TolB-like protein/Tfp pilus assembly protein PilF